MCLSFPASQAVIELPNADSSQNARNAVAVSRTDFHTLLFVNVLEKTVPIYSKMTHGSMTRKRMLMLLVHKNKVTFYARTLLTELHISIIHNRKKTNNICIVIPGLMKVILFLYGRVICRTPNAERRTAKCQSAAYLDFEFFRCLVSSGAALEKRVKVKE